MGNSYFNFKKFTIQQAGVAMKVGVDSVLLGSWTPVGNAKNGLDVGTGTGLLALMLAQKSNNLNLCAIEVDETAVEVASQNVLDSDFSSQIRVIHQSLQNFAKTETNTYDIIICNPPYFSEDIKPTEEARRIARHSDALRLDELLKCVSELLTEEGQFTFVFPYKEWLQVEELIKNSGFYIHRKTVVHPTAKKTPNRMLYQLGRYFAPMVESTIHIRNDGVYTQQYKGLTKDYYL